MIVAYPQIIVVTKCDKRALCQLNTSVPGSRGAKAPVIFRLEIQAKPGIEALPNRFVLGLRLVIRTIVNYQTFKMLVGLPRYTTQQATERGGTIVRRNDNRNRRNGHADIVTRRSAPQHEAARDGLQIFLILRKPLKRLSRRTHGLDTAFATTILARLRSAFASTHICAKLPPLRFHSGSRVRCGSSLAPLAPKRRSTSPANLKVRAKIGL